MDAASMEGGFTLTRFLIGGALAWAAVSVAFGPELVRTIVRLRGSRAFDAGSVGDPNGGKPMR